MSRRSRRDLALTLAQKADGDVKAMQRLASDPEIDDEAVGFHAQQAIEKWLKSVLSLHDLRYERKHDLGRLLVLLSRGGIDPPPGADWLDDLTIYAVEMRYEYVLGEIPPLDRERVLTLVDEVGAWAAEQLGLAGR